MSIDAAEVEKIARLAKLSIAAENISAYAGNLSAILDLAAKMERLDTDGVEPMAHPLDMVQRLRADDVSEANNRDEFQAIAPQTEAGLYLVPQVIE